MMPGFGNHRRTSCLQAAPSGQTEKRFFDGDDADQNNEREWCRRFAVRPAMQDLGNAVPCDHHSGCDEEKGTRGARE